MFIQSPISDDAFLIAIFALALPVFAGMLVLLRLIRRTGMMHQGKPETEHEPGRRDGRSTAATGDAAQDPFWDRMLGASQWIFLVALLLIAEFTLRSTLRRGWTEYPAHEGTLPVAVDSQGRLWATEYGDVVHRPDGAAPIRIPLPNLNDPAMPDSLFSIAFDRQGRLWIQTSRGRLGIRDSAGQWQFYAPERLDAPTVGSTPLIDIQGQAWTRGTDLSRIELDPERGIYRLVSAGLELIDAAALDSNGQVWALSAAGELKKLDLDGRWVTITILRKPEPDVTYAFSSMGPASLFIDHLGRPWIGDANGVLYLLETNGVLYTYPPEGPQTVNSGMVVDHEGNVWGVHGYEGLYRFHPETGWTAYNPRNSGLRDPYAAALALDGNGRVWFGSYGAGLTAVNPAETIAPGRVRLLGGLTATVIPAVLFSLVAAAAVTILPRRLLRESWTRAAGASGIASGAFGAAAAGLYVLWQRDLIASQIMKTLFGESWAHNDVFGGLGAPLLRGCLVPLAGVVGAGLCVLVVTSLLRLVHLHPGKTL